MRIAPGPVFLAVVLFSAPALAGPAATVADAKKGLDSARAKLAEVMKKVEGDAPTTADLDAAHDALNVFKDAIDAGASQEPNDLDYAKAALAARKELREKRDFVDGRRAKVHIFNHRRTIDAAMATLQEKSKATEAKQPAAGAYDEMRTAVAAAKKAADEGRPFASQDAVFANYLTTTDATISKLEKSADERWALQEGDKHKAKVEEARLAYVAAMAKLSASATDAEFGAADTTGKALATRLDEGKVLETKDKAGYGAYAAQTRAELAANKKKADELWSQTGLTRLKGEIAPTAKDLQGAAKIIRSRNPTADQLAEARTIAIVARKLLEKFEPEAQRSQAFGEYVNTVKGTLVEVENGLQLKGLDVAVKDFRAALLKVEKKTATDDDFSVANSSLLVLQKTLEPMNPKDPTLQQPVADARAWEREGKATITRRRNEIDVAARQAIVEAARGKATAIIGDFARAESGEEQVKEAEAAVADIGKALDDGKALIERDKTYAWYDQEVRKRMTEATGKITQRKLVLYAQATKSALSELLASAKTKIETARSPTGTDTDLAAAEKAVDAINAALEAKAELEVQAGSYAAAAEKARYELVKRFEALEVARRERDIRKRTVDSFNPALTSEQTASASSDMRVQKTEYEKAAAGFKSCKEEGAKILEANPASGRIAVVAGNLPSTVKDVVTQCGQKYDQTAPLVKPLVAMIAFEDGPKKAYEAAVALLGKGKKTEALAQFDECTATAVVLGGRYPELKERQFTVNGAQTGLADLQKTCAAKSRELLGKK
ncbi:MAG: hypothetical protein JNM17_05305 [Archangium sp.]|nr:hypothetical protein [Archangium sp.]